VRVVQLTDLHLKARRGLRTRGVDPWANLARVLARVRRDEPDRIVLTGDLAQDPRPETYVALRDLLADGSPVCFVPGNHDRRERLLGAWGAPGTKARFEERCGGWRLVGLDTSRRGRVHGRVGREQLRWLEARLAGEDVPTLLFLHHPPLAVGTWWLDKDLLRDRDALRRVVQGCGTVRGVFGGHVHQAHEGRFAGVPVFATPSTAYAFRPRARLPARLDARPPGYRRIDLAAGGFTTEVCWVDDPGT
jgi:Icc protein